MNRQDLLRPSAHKDNSKLRLITNYNPNNPDLRSLLRKYEGILLLTTKPAVKPEDIQVTYNKSPSIKDMIIKHYLTNNKHPRCANPATNPDAKLVDRWKPPRLSQTNQTIATLSEEISIASQQTLSMC